MFLVLKERTGMVQKKLTDVIDTYENSQMYLPSKYGKYGRNTSELSGAGSTKSADKFVKQTPTQSTSGNSQNAASSTRFNTKDTNVTRCWLCNEIGHRAVQCKNRRTNVGSFQEKRGTNEKSVTTSTPSNVKTGQAKIHRVVIEARGQPGTNLVGARCAQDIPELREPDPAVYLEADRICEEISRKQAMREELASRSVTSESVDDSVTTETVDAVVVPSHATLINKIDILPKDSVALSTGNASCDDKTKHASSFVSNSKAPLQLSELHYCDIWVKTADEGAKSVHCLQDSGAEISIIQRDLIKDMDVPVLGTVTIRGVIGQPAEATLVTLKVKPTTFGNHENIAPYIDVVFAACYITSDLQAILCDADLKKSERFECV